jgi:hypothetical protein
LTAKTGYGFWLFGAGASVVAVPAGLPLAEPVVAAGVVVVTVGAVTVCAGAVTVFVGSVTTVF